MRDALGKIVGEEEIERINSQTLVGGATCASDAGASSAARGNAAAE
jgi:hypothetical protein